MKQYYPLMTMILVVVALIGLTWYEVESGKPTADEIPIVSTPPASAITGKAVNDAASAASGFVSSLSISGKVPLTADNLPTAPSPLFESVQ